VGRHPLVGRHRLVGLRQREVQREALRQTTGLRLLGAQRPPVDHRWMVDRRLAEGPHLAVADCRSSWRIPAEDLIRRRSK
jgi:hypothetical protein